MTYTLDDSQAKALTDKTFPGNGLPSAKMCLVYTAVLKLSGNAGERRFPLLGDLEGEL